MLNRAGLRAGSKLNFIYKRFYSTPDLYRKVMRGVASPVTIVTCQDQASQEKAGMTISSMSSISLNPDPVISFNLHIPSRTARILAKNGGVCALNILQPTISNLTLARAFAGSEGQINPFEVYEEQFKEVDGVPILAGPGPVLLCKIEKTLAVQDHELAIAKVHTVIEGTSKGVVYQHGNFHVVGDIMNV